MEFASSVYVVHEMIVWSSRDDYMELTNSLHKVHQISVYVEFTRAVCEGHEDSVWSSRRKSM